MVVYETATRSEDGAMRGVRMAMPLSAVERIATVPVSEIEYAGGRALLQYGAELLPLEDEGGLLNAMDTRPGATVTALICLQPREHGVRRVGVVVRRVLDVCPGALLAEDTAICEGPLAMIGERVTALHPGFVAHAGMTPAGVLEGVA